MDQLNMYQILFSEIEKLLAEKDRVVVAIDGGAASGKTTLAGMLSERYGGAIVHMDDFFLRPEQRTPERFAEAGGNFDRERFTEVKSVKRSLFCSLSGIFYSPIKLAQ